MKRWEYTAVARKTVLVAGNGDFGANLRGANLQNANRLKDDSIPNGWQFAACGCCLEPAKQEQSK